MLVVCLVGSKLCGHALAYYQVLLSWAIQLVVDITTRRRYIVTRLLQALETRPLFKPISTIKVACQAFARQASKLPFIRGQIQE